MSLSLDLQKLLQFLPSKADFDSFAAWLELSFREDIGSLQRDTSLLNIRMEAVELVTSGLSQQLQEMDSCYAAPATLLRSLQLQLENLEDRNRRNNVQIQGFPETTPAAQLRDTVFAIFRLVLGDVQPEDIELDRVHRALGPIPTDPNRPCDVLSQMHFFTMKEIRSRKHGSNK